MPDIPESPQTLSPTQRARRSMLIGRRTCRPRPRLWIGAIATWPGVGAYDHLGHRPEPVDGTEPT